MKSPVMEVSNFSVSVLFVCLIFWFAFSVSYLFICIAHWGFWTPFGNVVVDTVLNAYLFSPLVVIADYLWSSRDS